VQAVEVDVVHLGTELQEPEVVQVVAEVVVQVPVMQSADQE
jgi:hypothetical protein